MPYTKSTLLSEEQTSALLKDTEWQQIASSVYRHTNGDMLLIGYNSSVLYQQVLYIENAKSILNGRFPYSEDFPDHIDSLIAQLSSLLNIPQSELRHMESLLSGEKKIKRVDRKTCLEIPYFPAMLAYLGELIRLSVNGSWKMELSKSEVKTWEPWIVNANGITHDAFFLFYYEMLEERLYKQRAPLRLASVIDLGRGRRPGMSSTNKSRRTITIQLKSKNE